MHFLGYGASSNWTSEGLCSNSAMPTHSMYRKETITNALSSLTANPFL